MIKKYVLLRVELLKQGNKVVRRCVSASQSQLCVQPCFVCGQIGCETRADFLQLLAAAHITISGQAAASDAARANHNGDLLGQNHLNGAKKRFIHIARTHGIDHHGFGTKVNACV